MRESHERRIFYFFILITLMITAPALAADKPNILVIWGDDIGWANVSAYNHAVMGYGTPNIDIEEGWLEVAHNGRHQKFLYPRQASSLYHTTKIMDTDLLWFYVRTWKLRVTDLMQGPVYGVFTDENENDKRLLPFFNYDEIFGTVLNRFVGKGAKPEAISIFETP